jgi:hypothetical protein
LPRTCNGKKGGKNVVEIDYRIHIQPDTGDLPSLDHRYFITPKEFRECLEGTPLIEMFDDHVKRLVQTYNVDVNYIELLVARSMSAWMKWLDSDKVITIDDTTAVVPNCEKCGNPIKYAMYIDVEGKRVCSSCFVDWAMGGKKDTKNQKD